MEGAMTRSQYVLLFAAIGGAVLFAAASALFSRKGAALVHESESARNDHNP
jgi:hypothetical protein